MKLLVVLVFVSTAKIVCAWDGQEVEFPVELLEADLKAIASYHSKIGGQWFAYVYWPNDLTKNVNVLQIHKKEIENETYLKICGDFKFNNWCGLTSTKSFGLFYKNGEFYYVDSKTKLLKSLSRNTLVHHTAISVRNVMIDKWFGEQCRGAFQPNATKRCLLIRYFSLQNIERFMSPFHIENTSDLKPAVDDSPAVYLAKASSCAEHFVEYTLSMDQDTPDVDGKLRVLVGKTNKKIVSLSSSLEAPKLVYDQNQRAFAVFDSSGLPVKDAYAVRMASIGFLAVTASPDYRLLSSEDLSLTSIPNQHMITVKNFLIKVRNSEPRYESRNQQLRPKISGFQVLGHIILKKVNFLNGGDKVDENCPLAIQYKTSLSIFSKPALFQYENREMQKICTDDSKLWAEPVDGTTGRTDEFDLDKFITLNYPAPTEAKY